MEARRAHNPEVVGSSPASATKELLKSKDFGSSSFLSGSKSWVFFREIPTDPYRDPYHDSMQWKRWNFSVSNAFKSKKFLKIKKILEKYLFRDLRVPDSMFNPSPKTNRERGFCFFRFDMCCLTIQISITRRND